MLECGEADEDTDVNGINLYDVKVTKRLFVGAQKYTCD